MKDYGRNDKIGLADESQIEVIAASVARAFQDDPFAIHMIPGPGERLRFLPLQFSAGLKMGIDFGRVFTDSGNNKGASIWFPPETWDLSLQQLEQSGVLALETQLPNGAFNRYVTAMENMDSLHRELMPEPHWFLAVIGVDPAAQGQGLGRALIATGIEEANRQGVPCYLETVESGNVGFYQRRGFRILREGVESSSGLNYWAMVRDDGVS